MSALVMVSDCKSTDSSIKFIAKTFVIYFRVIFIDFFFHEFKAPRCAVFLEDFDKIRRNGSEHTNFFDEMYIKISR